MRMRAPALEACSKNNKCLLAVGDRSTTATRRRSSSARRRSWLVPFLIMQGALDDNVLPEMQEKFAGTYRAAGGDCD